MFTTILSWLGGLLGGPFATAAVNAYRAKLESGNTQSRIEAELVAKEIALAQREAEVNSQIVLAEQGNWITRWVRPLWAAPFILWTWQAVVWDKLIMGGSTTTDPLDGMLGTLCITVATAYFGGRTLENVARIIKR